MGLPDVTIPDMLNYYQGFCIDFMVVRVGALHQNYFLSSIELYLCTQGFVQNSCI